MHFSRLRQLEFKLVLGFGLLFLCMVLTLGANLVVTTRYEAITDRLINHLYPARQQGREIVRLQLSLDSTGARYVLSYDPQQQTQLLKTYQQQVQELRTALVLANVLADTATQRNALFDFTQYFFGPGGYYASSQDIFVQKRAGQDLAASEAYARSPILPTIQQDINIYTGVVDQEIAQEEADESAVAQLSKILNIGLGGCASLFGLGIAFFITRSLRRLYQRIEEQNALLIENNARLHSLSTTDQLTELPNHRALQILIEKECERARRFGRPLSFLFFDGDRFKQVNDAYGHATGDVVLRELGERARSVLRAGDIVGRFGGEEFLVLLPETSPEEARIVAERLRTAVAASPLAKHEVEHGVAVTVSIGVATYPTDGATANEVREQADQAMYWAKRLGRNQVRTAVEAVRANCNAALKAATAQALERQELVAFDGRDPERQVRAEQMGLVYSLMGALDLRDPGTSVHAHQVSDLVAGMARELQFDEERIRRASSAAFLHDIGKIAIPDRLLHQPPQLFSAPEWHLLHQHAELGASIVEASPWLSDLAPAIRHHHECWDGTGSPDGLKGEDIPLEARLIAVAEAYHSMLTEHPYQAARSVGDALDELERCAGTQFDPALLPVFQAVLKSLQQEENASRVFSLSR
ncbi:MAG TPA: diguanylate cyclase [Ktedonobacteraceae bacterium]|nr:diguanylate cyclase [Ktedonobacteraceae bacterium]